MTTYEIIKRKVKEVYATSFAAEGKKGYRDAGRVVLITIAEDSIPSTWFEPTHQRNGREFGAEYRDYLLGKRKYSGEPDALTYTKAWRTYLDVLDELKEEGFLTWANGHSQMVFPGAAIAA